MKTFTRLLNELSAHEWADLDFISLGESLLDDPDEGLDEMAAREGDSHLSMLTVSSKWRTKAYKGLKSDNKTAAKTGFENVFLHHGQERDENGRHVDRYAILDHDTKEALTYQRFVKHPRGANGLHFDHYEQEATDRLHGGILPKGYNRAVAFRHLKASNVPLVSSDTQTESGHKMWRKMVDSALQSGHHVYYHDGKQLHKTTPENKEEHLNSYYGDTEEHRNRRMVISHDPLH